MPAPWPSIEEILGAQQEEQKHSGKGLLKNDQGIYMTKEGAFYVPNIPPSLRIRLMVVAHAGASGHRGMRTTRERLAAVFYWPDQGEQVDKFVRKCLVCLKTRGGGMQRRPLAHMIIHFDYIKMAKASKLGYEYILMIKDDFSL